MYTCNHHMLAIVHSAVSSELAWVAMAGGAGSDLAEMGCPERVAVNGVGEEPVVVAVVVQVAAGCTQIMKSRHGIASVSCWAGRRWIEEAPAGHHIQRFAGIWTQLTCLCGGCAGQGTSESLARTMVSPGCRPVWGRMSSKVYPEVAGGIAKPAPGKSAQARVARTSTSTGPAAFGAAKRRVKGGAMSPSAAISERMVIGPSGFRLTPEAVEKGAWQTAVGASSTPTPVLVSTTATYLGQVAPMLLSLVGVSTVNVTVPLVHSVPAARRLVLLLVPPRLQVQPLLAGLQQSPGC